MVSSRALKILINPMKNTTNNIKNTYTFVTNDGQNQNLTNGFTGKTVTSLSVKSIFHTYKFKIERFVQQVFLIGIALMGFIGNSQSQACTSGGNQTTYGNNSWIGYVYNSTNLTNYSNNYVTESEFFDRNWGTGKPNCAANANSFSVRYRMNKTFASGNYTFTIGADDGVRLSIDGGVTWIINDWSDHGYRTVTVRVPMSGNYNLVLEYYESGGDARVSFTYLASLTTDLLMPNGNVVSSVTACDGNFYDSGGSGNSYSGNEDRTVTFYPSNPCDKVRLTFTSFNTESGWDGMMIYNGNSISSPIISSGSTFNRTTCPNGAWSGTTSPGTITSTASDGSLTFRFRSDGSTHNAGWVAELRCIYSPSVISAGSDVSSCSGGNVVLSGSAVGVTLTTTGSSTFSYTGSGRDCDNFRIGGLTSGMPSGATITSIVFDAAIGTNCSSWYEWDFIRNNTYISSGCNSTGNVYNGLNGSAANGQTLELGSWDNDSYCDNVTMTASFTVNYTYSYVSTPTYSWSGGPIVNGGTTATPTVNPATTTTYTLTATSNGCSVSDNVTVTINNLPAVPTPSASNPNFCAPNTTNLVAKGMAPSDKAISFGTGSFSYVEVPNVPAYNFSGNNTIEAWVNPSATIGEGIIFNKENQYEAKVHSDGTLQWAYWTTSSWNWVNTGYVIPLNTWTHVAFVHNTTGTISTYVNGNLISGLPVATGSIQTTTSTFRIGNRGFNSPFYGKIDNVRLWSTARTQAQILADMYLETPTVTTNLIANYPLNGNGNALVGTNGTLTNAGGAAWVDANYYTYTWSNGPQLPTPSTNETQTTGSLTNANVGTHNYRVTATTAGCPGTLSSNVTVKVDQNPILPTSLAADYNNALYNCHGRQVELTATGGTLYGTSNYIYGTSSGGTQVSTATTNTTVTHIPTATTTNYYVGTTANGACAAQNSGILLTYNLPTAGTTLSGNNESATCYVNGNNYIHFYHSSGRLIASINPNGENLGSVTATSYVDAGLAVPACGDPTNPNYVTATMGRHWVITPTNQPASAVLVGLPFSPSEYSSVAAASLANANPNDNLTGIGSLKLSKYSGTNEDGLFSNNCGNGTTTLWDQSLSGNVTAYIAGFNASDQFAAFSIPSFSEFWLHGQTSSPLPVKLTNFSATCEKVVTLNWTTASEKNSDRFIVEKSRDGQTWNLVATQTAAGNSNTTLHYTQTDENSWNGLTYYRLRQVDYNGEEEIYGPISVSCEGNENSMTVYPNPNSGSFTIEIASTEMYNNAQLFLTDLTGKVITSQTVNVANGTTQILINDLDLKMGTYLVTLRGADEQVKPVKVMVLE